MEDTQRYIPLCHSVEKLVHGGFVVVGGERGGQPEAERPPRKAGRSAGEFGVPREYGLGCGSGDDEVFEIFAGHGELAARHRFRADFEGHPLGVVHKNTVAAVCPEERHVLVSLFTAGTTVVVPDIDRLPVLDQWSEALPQPVHQLADPQSELLVDEFGAVRTGGEPDRSGKHAGQLLAVTLEVDPQRIRVDPGSQAARGDDGAGGRGAVGICTAEICTAEICTADIWTAVKIRRPVGIGGASGVDGDRRVAASGKLEERPTVQTPGVVGDTHSQDVRQGRVDRDGRGRAVQGVSAGADRANRRQNLHGVLPDTDGMGFGGVVHSESGPDQPVAVTEPHLTSTVSMVTMLDDNGWQRWPLGATRPCRP